ncbi:MAG: hypothetical protein ABIC04_02770 [Nanoarchaeota archaeon]
MAAGELKSQDPAFIDCLNTTDEVNIRRGLLTPFNYHQPKGQYPFISLEGLFPPFRKSLREPQFWTHCHIRVIINGTFRDSYNTLMNLERGEEVRKTSIDELTQDLRMDEIKVQGIDGYQYDASHRFITHPEFSVLAEILMRTDNASIISRYGSQNQFALHHYGVKIQPQKDADVRKLISQLPEDKRPDSGSEEYLALKNRMAKKVYDLIAWPYRRDGGTKSMAAGSISILSTAPNLVVDLLRSSGVYSRIEVPHEGKIKTTHTFIQQLSQFDAPPPDDYRLGKKHDCVLVAFQYQRNSHHSLESCWVSLEKAYFVNPQNIHAELIPIVGLPTAKNR